MAFGVYLNSVTRDGPLVQTVLYLHHILNSESSPKAISEREPAISKDSFGISPLPTPHPRTFQRTWVRSSSAFYRTFNLDMGRSHGFGSTTTYSFALFRLAFAAAPSLQLNLACYRNSPVHSTKGTRALTCCRHTVSGSISLPFRGAFHLSLTVLVHYRSLGSI